MSATIFHRIHILGSTGSGKTHAATLLSRRLNIPAFDLDELFWDRSATTYGIRTPQGLRDRQLAAIVSQDSWIIEGVYYQWLAPSFDRADLILALTPPVWLRDARIVRRFVKRKLGMIPSRRESLRDLLNLLRWNHAYDSHNLPHALAFIQNRGRTIVECKSVAEVFGAIDLPPTSS